MPTMTKRTDWRKTCAELIENVRYLIDCVDRDCFDPVALVECREHLSQTRTALAQPEPEVAGLSDDAIEADFRSWYNERYHHHYFGAIPLVECIEWTRYALTRYATPQPEPEGVTDEEIEQEAIANADTDDEYRAFKSGAFFVQERISRPTIKPVPVSEPVPGREDCNDEGEVWVEEGGIKEQYFDEYEWIPHAWVLREYSTSDELRRAHWYPHNALPVPGAEVG